MKYGAKTKLKKKYKPPVTDVTSGNPDVKGQKGKKGYFMPYADDTNKSPYKPGPRGTDRRRGGRRPDSYRTI